MRRVWLHERKLIILGGSDVMFYRCWRVPPGERRRLLCLFMFRQMEQVGVQAAPIIDLSAFKLPDPERVRAVQGLKRDVVICLFLAFCAGVNVWTCEYDPVVSRPAVDHRPYLLLLSLFTLISS